MCGDMGRVAEMRFDRVGYGPWESSGSEHSAGESSLSDMVKSFMEKEFDEGGGGFDAERDDEDGDAENGIQDEARSNWETMVELRRLMSLENDTVKSSLLAEVEMAKRALEDSRSSGSSSWSGCLSGFSRQLMTRLRARGLDAGLCKSKWQKHGSIPAGDYEHIDIISSNNTRYIIELSLADHFTIARPTTHYLSLLETVPEISIGTVEEMKQVVKLMCRAMKVSMACRDMKVPPWRKHAYMKVKWFGSYKRTTKSVSTKVSDPNNTCKASLSWQRSVGFEVLAQNPSGYVLNSFRDEMRRKTKMDDGLLAAAFRLQQTEI